MMNPAHSCLVSLNAYHRIYPESFFRRKLEKSDLEHAKDSLVFHGFCKLFELAKEMKDYFVILRMIEQDVEGVFDMISKDEIENFREKFENLRNETDKELLNRFESYFKEEQKKV